MKWSEISIHTTQEAIEAVANILHDVGARGVVIEDREILDRKFENKFGEIYQLTPEDFPEEGAIVKAYFPVNSYLLETVEQTKVAINNLPFFNIDFGQAKVFVSEIDEEDWATSWKKYYKPLKVSDKIIITPTWEIVENDSDCLVIELDPGMAFGTGTHPTTIMSIQALEKMIVGDEEVIDVGCGTGILSIAAAKLGAKKVLALDLDHVAITSAKLNIELNKVDSIIDVRQNDLLNGIDNQADVIVANILAEVIITFIADVKKLLKDSGVFIASGIINTKADLVKNSLEKEKLIIIEELHDQDWVTFIAKKDESTKNLRM
ncbi:MAG: 50S ribosomal protein L11 methyltransferase [Vulcanibacillus sp.]